MPGYTANSRNSIFLTGRAVSSPSIGFCHSCTVIVRSAGATRGGSLLNPPEKYHILYPLTCTCYHLAIAHENQGIQKPLQWQEEVGKNFQPKYPPYFSEVYKGGNKVKKVA